MAYRLIYRKLGIDPVETMMTITGTWALRFLLITLAITTIRKQFGINFIKYRRMLGIFVAFYALLHLLIYVILGHSLDLSAIIQNIAQRKFIIAGMLAFTLLTPLVITSTKKMMKRLGKNWIRLHKIVYAVFFIRGFAFYFYD